MSDLNIVRLSSIATFSDSTKARVGKISGIIDPVFGILDGYGAYFQSLYATRNVNIAGTLTAGDESGFASTFYVGKIHKNVIPDSVGCCFSGGITVEENSRLVSVVSCRLTEMRNWLYKALNGGGNIPDSNTTFLFG